MYNSRSLHITLLQTGDQVNVQTDQTKQHGANGATDHNGNGHGPDPAALRFHDIEAELEQLPSVTPAALAQTPAWVRNPLEKARGLILMVIKKASGGGTFNIREGIIYAVCGVALSFGVTNYFKRQEEHDELIRLRTVVEITEKTNAERDLRIETARNFATVADKNVTRLEGKIDQFMQIYSIKNADKAKLTFDRE